MAPDLRVDPQVLTAAASTMASCGSAVGEVKPGEPLNAAAAGMSGLASGGACQRVGPLLNTDCQNLGKAVTGFADSLRTAATKYQSTDAAAGTAIGKTMPGR
ncbi:MULTISPECIES: type VII secretion target [unclassified Mycobacterium]|uniref:type VII secretion target n=1 Tax=unclassified Mycobacterium TaxID=2642494 RepID=UPI00048A52BF|nr:MULTISPECIES: type VII secretion target [unclassified Mycobacterium]SEB21587.1 Excreted virulence factor EspC, type VII ESX diderm [Mycobacterium sp. 283mftsu]